MRAKRTLQSLMIFAFVMVFLLGGCVTRARFETQVAESQSLARQLDKEAQKRRRLEEEVASLKNKLAALRGKLASLERDLALARNKAGQSDELSTELARLKRSYEDELKQVKVQLADREARLSELKTRLENQNREHEKRQALLDSRDRERTEHLALLDRKDKEISELREALHLTKEDLERLRREFLEASEAHKKLVSHLKKEVNDGSVTISKLKKGRLSVKIADKVLFPSGSDQITEEGKEVLKKVSAALINVTENNIRIEGHADNVPIGPSIINRFPTNWELSSSRATQVVRFLVSQSVPAESLIATGYSMHHPVASNDTAEGRQKNRRIEIVLLPKEDVGHANSEK
ncbi:MAG: OmpA family protein [Nitrospiria bacterium]